MAVSAMGGAGRGVANLFPAPMMYRGRGARGGAYAFRGGYRGRGRGAAQGMGRGGGALQSQNQ